MKQINGNNCSYINCSPCSRKEAAQSQGIIPRELERVGNSPGAAPLLLGGSPQTHNPDEVPRWAASSTTAAIPRGGAREGLRKTPVILEAWGGLPRKGEGAGSALAQRGKKKRRKRSSRASQESNLESSDP